MNNTMASPLPRKGARALFIILVMLCFHESLGLAPVHHDRFLDSQTSIAHQTRITTSRRIKSTKGSGTKTNDDNDVSSSKMGPQTLTVTGLQMTLSDVSPLDSGSRMTWQDVTRDFIETDIWESEKDIKNLKVDIYFDRQDPPYESRELTSTDGRSLVRRFLPESELTITFDVDMVVESKDARIFNAFDLVSNAFNTEKKRAAYMQELRATFDPAFESASMNTNLVSSAAPASNGRRIGIIVGVMILVLVIIAGVLYALHGNRTNNNETTTQVVPELNDKDADDTSASSEVPQIVPDAPRVSTSRPNVSAPAESPSAASRRSNGIPRTIVIDDESQYYDGTVSVAWSMDTENQTQISNIT